MARFCPLFSGSSGNSTYIAADKGGLLVDVGVSFKRLQQALFAAGGDTDRLRAVLITHEHKDHISGLRVFLKRCPIPVIASAQTLQALNEMNLFPEGADLIPIETALPADEFGITRFATGHDCPGSSGYVITLPDGTRVAVCTDLGSITDEVQAALLGCAAVLLESNHDIVMLKNGPYPPQLKLRILSDRGHLSNPACAAVLPALVQSGTTRLILGHLSRENNTPLLALSTAKAALCDAGITAGRDCLLQVARPAENEVTVL